MTPFDSLTGFPVRVDKHLVGSKKAVLFGGTIYVSPAMLDLMQHADEGELRKLLEAIHVVRIPKPDLSAFGTQTVKWEDK